MTRKQQTRLHYAIQQVESYERALENAPDAYAAQEIENDLKGARAELDRVRANIRRAA